MGEAGKMNSYVDIELKVFMEHPSGSAQPKFREESWARGRDFRVRASKNST